MNLKFCLVIQITIGSINCILIPTAIKEDRGVVPRLGRASTWESVLRQAAYQSLTKYTGYTDSLDEKIQRDQVLWSKILAAHIQRTNKQDGDINTKTGTLVDDPSGVFEFRREKSIQTCTAAGCLDNSKLLAVWKIQRVKPNHLIVRMKVALTPSIEDLYQYSPTMGLKLQNSLDMQQTQTTTFIPDLIEMPKKNKSMVFPEQGQVNHRNFHNLYKAQQSQERPVTLYYVPTEQSTPSHIIFPQSSNVLQSHDLVAQHNIKDRFPINSQTVKALLSEFQNEQKYDGFLPMMPTENPFKSTVNYNTQFKLNKSPTIRGNYKFKQTTPPNFKPSTHFVQYSEHDPIYYQSTEKIPPKEFFIENKTPYKELYLENPRVPVKENGNRKIPVKDLYVDNLKYPSKGSFLDGEYLKEFYINTGRPFELTSVKELQDSSINYHTYTTPKENHFNNRFINKGHKHSVHITTLSPEIRYPEITTPKPIEYPILTTEQSIYQQSNRQQANYQQPNYQHRIREESYPVHLTTETSHKYVPTQTAASKYPVIVTTQEPFPDYESDHEKYPVQSTQQPEIKYSAAVDPDEITQKMKNRVTEHSVRFPSHVTTEASHRTSFRVTTDQPKLQSDLEDKIKIRVTTSDKILESIESDEEIHRPSPTPGHKYHRRRPIGIRRKPVRTEPQEVEREIEKPVHKHPTSINDQLLEIDSQEKRNSFESGTNNISSEKESTDEVPTTGLPTTTTNKYTRKYNKKPNRNWNHQRNNIKSSRNKTRSSNYFNRWGDRVRSTTELPVIIKNRLPSRITTTTEIPQTPHEVITEDLKDSEVYESQTHSSIEIAPSDLGYSDIITTTKRDDELTTTIRDEPTTIGREETTTTKRDETTTTTKRDEITTTKRDEITTGKDEIMTTERKEDPITERETETPYFVETTPYPTTQQQGETKFRNKTPEEIVNELTELGLRSMQVDETTPQTQVTMSSLIQKPPDLLARLQVGQYKPNLEDNETSLVINRVSKSISFKTARGLSGRIMQPTNILPTL